MNPVLDVAQIESNRVLLSLQIRSITDLPKSSQVLDARECVAPAAGDLGSMAASRRKSLPAPDRPCTPRRTP